MKSGVILPALCASSWTVRKMLIHRPRRTERESNGVMPGRTINETRIRRIKIIETTARIFSRRLFRRTSPKDISPLVLKIAIPYGEP
jgi:hypothetical protein